VRRRGEASPAAALLRKMGAMNEPNNALHSGDAWVPGSRRYADFEDYLLTRERWKHVTNNGRPRVAIKPDPDEYLAQRFEELHRELATVNRMMSRGKLQNAWIEDGELGFVSYKISIPKGMKEFTQKVYEQMPRVGLTDLLVEVASWTGFTQHFTHKTGEPAKDLELILAAILADGTNLGLSKMAGASADS
jgi:Tn3 transposase DDE domain